MRRTAIAILSTLTWVVRLCFFSSLGLASADWALQAKQSLTQHSDSHGNREVPRFENRRPVPKHIQIAPPRDPSSFSLPSLTAKGITFHTAIRTKVNRSLATAVGACLATALCIAGVPTIVGAGRGR